MNEDLPEGWTTTTLSVVADVNPRHPKDLDDDLMVTFVPMPVVNESDWKLGTTQERPLGKVRTGYTHFADGDVLFAKITPCMENGKAAVATDLRNGLGCGTTELHVLRPHAGIDAKYIYHFIHQESFRREAVNNFTGTAGQLRVPVDFIRTADIPLPPSKEQRRIVAQVEGLLAKVRASQDRLDKVPVILKRFRQAVLTAACNGQLTARERGVPIDDAWEEKPLGDVLVAIEAGKSFACEERPPKSNEVGVLKISAVTWGVFDETESKTCTDPALINKDYLVRAGDLLMTRANTIELVGAVALVGRISKRLMLSDKTLRLRVGGEVSQRWVLYWLRSRFGRDQIESLATGNQQSMRNISQGSIRAITIRVPPLAEQKRIEAAVEALMAVADRIEKRYQTARTQVDKLTQSILAKAFQGELVPTEAELAQSEERSYETAEQLLARIKNQLGTRVAVRVGSQNGARSHARR